MPLCRAISATRPGARGARGHRIDTIVNFAAETHVDRSLSDAGSFIKTDVYGTYVLLEAAKELGLERYHQVSTDEVYGQVLEGASVETDRIDTRSPYSASKAGGDLMVLAYHTSFGLPVTITRGSNSIGPYQYPEKVVPLFITNALDDQAAAHLWRRPADARLSVCRGSLRGDRRGAAQGRVGRGLQPGHGRRDAQYRHGEQATRRSWASPSRCSSISPTGPAMTGAMRSTSTRSRRWAGGPRHDFDRALEQTVRWYVDNEWWWRKIKSGEYYKDYYQQHYQGREVDTPKS